LGVEYPLWVGEKAKESSSQWMNASSVRQGKNPIEKPCSTKVWSSRKNPFGGSVRHCQIVQAFRV
jgi:hypothetical protein